MIELKIGRIDGGPKIEPGEALNSRQSRFVVEDAQAQHGISTRSRQADAHAKSGKSSPAAASEEAQHLSACPDFWFLLTRMMDDDEISKETYC